MTLRALLVASALVASVAAVSVDSAEATAGASTRPAVSVSEAAEIGFQAYQYGYPLVLFGQTQLISTNVATASDRRAPANQMTYGKVAGPDETDVVLPNVNVLYNNSFLNLQAEPIVLHIPDTQGRFFIQEILDAWTNVQFDPGSRIASPPGDYLIAGPGWKGTVPGGIDTVYRMPTQLAWIAGRNFTTGQQSDLQIATQIQAGFTLVPLSSYGKPYTPPVNPVDPKIDMTTPPVSQVANLSATAFFKAFANWWATNPPQAVDGQIVARLKRVGLVPGRPYDLSAQPPAVRLGMTLGARAAYRALTSELAVVGLNRPINGWTLSTGFDGQWGKNYLRRAVTAYRGIGANARQDAVYGYANRDSRRALLDGSNSYTITFPAGSLPPVAQPYGQLGFWSVTVYDADGFLGGEVPNVLGSTDLTAGTWKPDADGSYSIVVQQSQPGDGTNWIKPPSGNFILLLRMYNPDPSVYSTTNPYSPPPITPTGTPRPPQFGGTAFVPPANGRYAVPR